MAQTISHIVNECPLTKLSDGGLERLHLADNDAINWLEQTMNKNTRKLKITILLFIK